MARWRWHEHVLGDDVVDGHSAQRVEDRSELRPASGIHQIETIGRVRWHRIATGLFDNSVSDCELSARKSALLRANGVRVVRVRFDAHCVRAALTRSEL